MKLVLLQLNDHIGDHVVDVRRVGLDADHLLSLNC